MARNKKRPTSKGSSNTTKRGVVEATKDVSTTASTEGSPSSDSKEEAKNDPMWYARDERLLIDSASIPFSEPFGSDITLNADPHPFTDQTAVIEDTTNRFTRVAGSAPGIMVFNIHPSYGNASNIQSPLNVAATALYAHVRYVNNGRKNYDPADLAIYCLAITELYSYLSWLRRIYGCMFAYSQANWYIGKHLVQAMGVNADDVLANLANFRYGINVLINKVSAYAIPADMALILRRAFQFSNVYIEHEGDSIKDQLYMYNPRSFYRYTLDYQQKGCLQRLTALQSASDTVQQLLDTGDKLLQNIWGDEDFGLMSGDILRAFQGNIVHLESLPEDYVLVPVHDKAVLTQMENSTLCNPLWEGFDVTQEPTTNYYKLLGDTGDSKFYPGTVMQSASGLLVSMEIASSNMEDNDDNATNRACLEAACDKILNIHEAHGDPALVIEAVQNMVSSVSTVERENVVFYGDWKSKRLLLYPGAVIVATVTYWRLDSEHHTMTGASLPQCIKDNASMLTLTMDIARTITNFKYCPKVFLTRTENYTDPWSVGLKGNKLVGRLDTYAIITNGALRNMLQTSLLSLLYVPGVAKYVNSLS